MKRFLIGLSVGFNLLVLVPALGLLIALAVGWGGDLVRERFVGPGHDRWVSQFELLPVRPGDIVFLGDSITEGGAWEEWFPGLPVRNRGIGGDTTEQVLARLQQVTAGQPAKVFLLIGTNDLAMGSSVEEVAARVERIVERLRTDSPTTQVIVQSVLPRGADYRERVEALNTQVATSLRGAAVWLDLYPVFLDAADGSIRNDLSNDELHLLGAGYLAWRDAISALVRPSSG